jgi:ricin-type beta-trefoil lectin protein
MRKPRLLTWMASAAGIVTIIVTIAACVIAINPFGEVSTAQAAVGLRASAQSTATPPIVGVQDSWVSATCWGGSKDGQVPAVSSHYWAGLHASTVRFSPTWDIAYPYLTGKDAKEVGIERSCFGTWLNRLAAKGVSAEIAFKPDYCFHNNAGCPDKQTGNVVIPTLTEYQVAIKDFLDDYPQVTIIAPWGEPDFQPGPPKPTKKHKHPTAEPPFRIGGAPGTNFGSANCPKTASVANCGPMLAAAMWVTVETQCPTCTVIAGDFGGDGSHDYSYLKSYNRYLSRQGYRPTVWGIHPYGDVKHEECELARAAGSTVACAETKLPECEADTLVACFSGWLHADKYGPQTQLWLDEVSSFFTGNNAKSGQWTRQVQAGGARYLLQDLPHTTAPGDPAVTRIYYMRFAGKNNDALIVPAKREGKWTWKAEPVYLAVASILTSWSPASPVTAPPTPPTPAAAPSVATSAPAQPVAVTGYEIRNSSDNLCLDANDAGPTAGRSGDEVRLWDCYGAVNQEWIPQYKSGTLAWLVNAKYPGMCLNADDTGGLANGRRAQLWNCYNSGNELWNVGTLLANPLGAPLLLGAAGQSLALDADKYDLGNGDTVQVWAYYGGDNQTWYPVPA